jgi:hypothetical protein
MEIGLKISEIRWIIFAPAILFGIVVAHFWLESSGIQNSLKEYGIFFGWLGSRFIIGAMLGFVFYLGYDLPKTKIQTGIFFGTSNNGGVYASVSAGKDTLRYVIGTSLNRTLAPIGIKHKFVIRPDGVAIEGKPFIHPIITTTMISVLLILTGLALYSLSLIRNIVKENNGAFSSFSELTMAFKTQWSLSSQSLIILVGGLLAFILLALTANIFFNRNEISNSNFAAVDNVKNKWKPGVTTTGKVIALNSVAIDKRRSGGFYYSSASKSSDWLASPYNDGDRKEIYTVLLNYVIVELQGDNNQFFYVSMPLPLHPSQDILSRMQGMADSKKMEKFRIENDFSLSLVESK